jgi:hypothetical protein
MTYYDWDYRETEIIDFWINQRDNTRTALVPFETEPEQGTNLSSTVSGEVNIPPSIGDTVSVDPASLTGEGGTEMEIDDDAPASSDGLSDDTPSAWEFGHLDEIVMVPPRPIFRVIREDDEDEDEDSWTKVLEERYSPKAMAYALFSLVGPHLSPQARARKYQDGRHGINVRGSFCLGVEAGDIFDLDVLIDNRDGGVVPDAWRGPREEEEKDRWWSKLEARQWF